MFVLNNAFVWVLLLIALVSGTAGRLLCIRARRKGVAIWAAGAIALGIGGILVLLTLTGRPTPYGVELELANDLVVDVLLILGFLAVALGLSTLLGRPGEAYDPDAGAHAFRFSPHAVPGDTPASRSENDQDAMYHKCADCEWRVAIGTPNWRSQMNDHRKEAHPSGKSHSQKPRDLGGFGKPSAPPCASCNGPTVLVPTNNQFYCSRCGRYT